MDFRPWISVSFLSLVLAAAASSQSPPGLSELPVSTTTSGRQVDAKVAADADFDRSPTPGPEQRINLLPVGEHRVPQVAVNGSGETVVVWASDGEGVFLRRYDDHGLPQGEALSVRSDSPLWYLARPSVAIDGDGDVVVVWRDFASALSGRSFDRSGTSLASEFVVGVGSCGEYEYRYCSRLTKPRLATLNDHFLVVWEEEFESWPDAVGGQRFDKDGTLRGEPFVLDRNSSDYGYVRAPAVASDSAGRFVVVYDYFEYGLYDETRARLFDAASEPQGDRVTVVPNTAGGASVATAASRFLVAWSSHDEVLLRDWSTVGLPLSDEMQASSFTEGRQSRPAVAVAETGVSVVVWESRGGPAQDDSGSDVFGRRFTSTGAPLGDEFPIASTTLLDQTSPAVASDAEGNFVVVWESEREDGGFDVLLRRFAAVDCVSDDVTLCLNDGRFEVRAQWRDFKGNVGQGRARELTADTGYFWFFDPDNVEVVLKVLDARHLNGYFWVFYGALSNVEYTLTVTDTATGDRKTYTNPLESFASVGDTRALPTAGPASRPSRPATKRLPRSTSRQGGGCGGDEFSLCLNDERFRLEMAWEDFHGNTGIGQPRQLTADTGCFWFFDPDNIEVVVKVLDARHLNGHFWVFYGALSNVSYTLQVTDTVTGLTRRYKNPAGRFASVGDTQAIP